MAMTPKPRIARLRVGLAVILMLVVGVVLAACAAALATTATASKHAVLSEHRIREIGLAAATRDGDSHPTLMQHGAGTRAADNRVGDGDQVPGSAWSYLIAIRGHFVLKNAPRPPGVPAPSGSVLTLVVNAKRGEITDFGVSKSYPRLKQLGPVTTDLRARYVPRVAGRSLFGAYRVLHAGGFRVTYTHATYAGSQGFFGCYPLIKGESPAPATGLARGGTVRLIPDMPACALASPVVPKGNPWHTVPNFRGKSLSVVAKWAGSHNVTWNGGKLRPLIKGDAPNLLANYRVTAQKPRPGSRLRMGYGGSSHKNGVTSGWFRLTPVTVKAHVISH
jgi:hypothetical protein